MEHFAISLLLGAEFEKITFGALFDRGIDIRRRQSLRHFGFGNKIVLPFRVSQDVFPGFAGQTDRICLLRWQIRKLLAKGRLRRERYRFSSNDLRAIQHLQLRVEKISGDIESHFQRNGLVRFGWHARKVQSRVGIRQRDTADFQYREPNFGEVDRLLRIEKSIRFLVSEESRLNLDVGTVIIRKRVAPFQALGIAAPGKHFFRRQIGPRGIVHNAGIRFRMINRHVRLIAGITEPRNWAKFMIPDDAEVHAGAVDRPRVQIRESVGDGKFLRVIQTRIIPRLHSRVSPPVETMPRRTRIVERGSLLKHRLARMQC